MITGELKSKVDGIWNTMWSGGISNPLSVIEQLTYLLFIKGLDELHTRKFVNVNDHYECDANQQESAEMVIQMLEDCFDASVRRSNRLIDQVMSLK